MFAALAKLIDRRPWWVLTVALAIIAVAAPIGIHVRDDLKPRGFDVAGSSSAEARKLVAKATNTDPADTVLALVRLPAALWRSQRARFDRGGRGEVATRPGCCGRSRRHERAQPDHDRP